MLNIFLMDDCAEYSIFLRSVGKYSIFCWATSILVNLFRNFVLQKYEEEVSPGNNVLFSICNDFPSTFNGISSCAIMCMIMVRVDDDDDDDDDLTELLVRSRVVGFKSGGGGGSRV